MATQVLAPRHPGIYAYHGRRLVEKWYPEPLTYTTPEGQIPPNFPELDILRANIAQVSSPLPIDPVGILGAGPGGLYAALILTDLGIPFKVIEATDRVGGRLYTHKFGDKTGEPFNYYDVGAMRFPEFPKYSNIMNRLARLFADKRLNEGDDKLQDKLIEYIFESDEALLSYNGVTITQAENRKAGDHFNSASVLQGVEDQKQREFYLTVGAGQIESDVFQPFIDALLKDLNSNPNNPNKESQEGWDFMMKFDKHSVRSYMATHYKPSEKLQKVYQQIAKNDKAILSEGLPTDVINWMETFNNGTGGYDLALTEGILHTIAFGAPAAKPKYKCIRGGAVELANAMYKYVTKKQPDGTFIFNKRVDAVVSEDRGKVKVTAGDKTYTFSHVISTIPLPVLRTLDLSNAGLSPMQANAIRELDYSASSKIGMQFRSAWWTTSKTHKGENMLLDPSKPPLKIVGGQTFTDRPIRTVVYPSLGEVRDAKTTTLIASYTWNNDAARLGALIQSDKKALDKLVLRHLAEIHNVNLKLLTDEFIESYPWAWNSDVNTMGAFAWFGPGKFENLYKHMTLPAGKGYIHFAGEAISVRHAWVEGALDSVWRSINCMLLNTTFKDKRLAFWKEWGKDLEWTDRDEEVEEKPMSSTAKGRVIASMAETTPIEPIEPDIFSNRHSLLYRHLANSAKYWQI